MEKPTHYPGQRLSLKKQLCTVRYVGPVADKPGEWLGVEWDDPSRGKHDGTHDGVQYFTCTTAISAPIKTSDSEAHVQAGANPQQQHLSSARNNPGIQLGIFSKR